MSVSRKQIKSDRRRRRELAEQSRLVDERQVQRRRYMLLGGLALGLLVFVGIFALVTLRADRSITEGNTRDAGRRSPDRYSVGYPDQGNQHIAGPTSPHTAYNSNPPTSGPHTGNLAPGGWHDETVPTAMLVHNMEDGFVNIWYRPDLPADQKEQLRALVEQAGDKVVAAPYTNLNKPIALTAWTRMDKLDTFNGQRIQDFISAYRGIDHHKGST